MRIVPATQTSYAYIEFDTEDLKRIAELADQIATRGVVRIGGPDPRDAVVAAAQILVKARHWEMMTSRLDPNVAALTAALEGMKADG